jgi:hypothetical protein
MSMVMDHYGDQWGRRYWPNTTPVQRPVPPLNINVGPFPTPAELDEFRRLLDRAREYDKRNNEPDCELAEKRQLLLDMAKKLGVDIDFVNAPGPSSESGSKR